MGMALFLSRTIRSQRYLRHETAQHPQDTEMTRRTVLAAEQAAAASPRVPIG
jgi:hypothetical protein